MTAGLVAAFAVRMFLVHERRSATPILPLHLFRRADFSGLNFANALVAFAGFAIMLIVPYFLARLTALDIGTAGLVLACSPLGTAVVSAFAGRLIETWGARAAAGTAAALTAAGLAGIGLWPSYPGVVLMAVPLFLTGAGLGLFQVSVLDVITGTMPPAERGVAGSLAQVTRTVGVITAASLLSLAFAMLSGGRAADDASFQAGFSTVFLVVALLPALVAAWLFLGRRREPA